VAIDETHDPDLRSWVPSANASGADFPIQNLPFGVFRSRGTDTSPRIGVAIGDQILDLARSRHAKRLDGLSPEVLRAVEEPTMNALMSVGHRDLTLLRARLSAMLKADGGHHREDFSLLVPMHEADLLLPAAIGDYTDFYASIFHATRVGKLFRPENPQLPNYKHLPVAYHGRSSSIVVGGTAIARPAGQRPTPGGAKPERGPSERLDYELEIGAFVGAGNSLGCPIPLQDAEEHLFGLCLLNDWSARDIQTWEAQPLGPFLSKNFASSISPWVITLEALAPFRCPAAPRPPDDPELLPYLSSAPNDAAGAFDVTLDVFLRSARMREAGIEPWHVSRGNFREMYWTVAQMVAHHTSNGCNLRPGDLIGSGTVSGSAEGSAGCLLEITRQGAAPIELPTGEKRAFLADGDEVILRGSCERAGRVRIGFGECRGLIASATT
jgi:fumarylacetoacetase